MSVEKPTIIRVPSQKELHKAFRPYAVELGHLVFGWNRLQERLVTLFCLVSGCKNPDIAQAIWHSTPSDLSQRKMLRAAVEVSLNGQPKVKDEIIWLLNKIDNFLSDKRNDALHTPYMMMTSALGTYLDADWMSHAPRARKLRRKDLLKEFTWYREYTDALAFYARQIQRALKLPNEPWPDRAPLPHLGQKTTRAAAAPKKKNKSPPSRS